MKKIGVVEGYYGKSSNFDDRKKIIESLNRHDLNFYLYAPKEDPFLRSHIDIEYTKEWLTAFRDFVDFSRDHSVNVGVGLAPVKTADTVDLKEKIKVFVEQGIGSFSILFDDIEESFCFEKQLEIFNDVKTSFAEISFDFCPTVYSTELINKDKKHNDYFNDFINHFPKSSNFFWTGDKVISIEMNKDSQSSLSDFKRLLISDWKPFLFFGFFLVSIVKLGLGAPVKEGAFDVGDQVGVESPCLGISCGAGDAIPCPSAGC